MSNITELQKKHKSRLIQSIYKKKFGIKPSEFEIERIVNLFLNENDFSKIFNGVNKVDTNSKINLDKDYSEDLTGTTENQFDIYYNKLEKNILEESVNLSDEDFTKKVYKIFLGRLADKEGLKWHVELIKKSNKHAVIASIGKSDEAVLRMQMLDANRLRENKDISNISSEANLIFKQYNFFANSH